jgi:hypothetical protein
MLWMSPNTERDHRQALEKEWLLWAPPEDIVLITCPPRAAAASTSTRTESAPSRLAL